MEEKIIVFGSISTDFVVTSEKRPKLGETITGQDFKTTFGGKGANQTVAAARLGGKVYMVGTVGEDIFGEELIENLKENNIHTNYVKKQTDYPSGSAHITLFEEDNSIIYIPGANNQITPERIKKLEEFISTAGIVVIQNEIPQEVVNKIINLSFKNKVKVLYNPAPARKVAKEILEKASYITPDESEFHELFPDLSISEALAKYPNQLILTMGSRGVYFHDGEKERQIPAYQVKPTNTTGAGDTFNGAFAFGMVSGFSIEKSILFGNYAASLSIQKFGAQSGMPTMEEMKEFPTAESLNLK